MGLDSVSMKLETIYKNYFKENNSISCVFIVFRLH